MTRSSPWPPTSLSFEGFSLDESSYGCLTVDREAFAGDRDVTTGTTNVDDSWKLRENFQLLRSYRQTRFVVDPAGFELARAEQGEGDREENIELPGSWLRGFLQLQSAMSLPMRRVCLSREGLYSVLAFLKRHKATRSPRAVRFELTPGRPVTLVLEPWEERIVLHDRPYDGPKAETIRVWGRDRLRVLARLLPILDEAEVYLLGTGLPSFWSVRMGEMRLLLGLSGRTAHDWTGESALARLAPPLEPGRYLATRVAAGFRANPRQTLVEVAERAGGTQAEVLAVLNQLAGLGQVLHDLHAGVYRWRPLLPVTPSADWLGPEDPETVAAREIARTPVGPGPGRRDPSRRSAGRRRPGSGTACLLADRRRRPDAPGPLQLLAPRRRRLPQRSLPPPPGPPGEGVRPPDGPSSLDGWFASLRA